VDRSRARWLRKFTAAAGRKGHSARPPTHLLPLLAVEGVAELAALGAQRALEAGQVHRAEVVAAGRQVGCNE